MEGGEEALAKLLAGVDQGNPAQVTEYLNVCGMSLPLSPSGLFSRLGYMDDTTWCLDLVESLHYFMVNLSRAKVMSNLLAFGPKKLIVVASKVFFFETCGFTDLWFFFWDSYQNASWTRIYQGTRSLSHATCVSLDRQNHIVCLIWRQNHIVCLISSGSCRTACSRTPHQFSHTHWCGISRGEGGHQCLLVALRPPTFSAVLMWLRRPYRVSRGGFGLAATASSFQVVRSCASSTINSHHSFGNVLAATATQYQVGPHISMHGLFSTCCTCTLICRVTNRV